MNGMAIIPGLIDRLTREHPRMAITVTSASPSTALDAFLDDLHDVVIAPAPGTIDHSAQQDHKARHVESKLRHSRKDLHRAQGVKKGALRLLASNSGPAYCDRPSRIKAMLCSITGTGCSSSVTSVANGSNET